MEEVLEVGARVRVGEGDGAQEGRVTLVKERGEKKIVVVKMDTGAVLWLSSDQVHVIAPPPQTVVAEIMNEQGAVASAPAEETPARDEMAEIRRHVQSEPVTPPRGEEQPASISNEVVTVGETGVRVTVPEGMDGAVLEQLARTPASISAAPGVHYYDVENLRWFALYNNQWYHIIRIGTNGSAELSRQGTVITAFLEDLR